MHILVVNDDGPPSSQSSPYIHSLIHTLQSSGHVVSVVLPHRQRSWIGKAHLVGATVKPTYFHPGTLFQDDGTIHSLPRSEEGEGSEGDEWILIDSTPASCVQIGLFHYFQDRGPVDLVISGPNYGRNSTAVFSLSSGTIGGAMEAAVCGYKAIALSFAFSSRDHDPVVISEAANHSVRLIEHLYKNWTSGVDLYSINVPLEQGISKSRSYFELDYAEFLDEALLEAYELRESLEANEEKEECEKEWWILKPSMSDRAQGIRLFNSEMSLQKIFEEWEPEDTDSERSISEEPDGDLNGKTDIGVVTSQLRHFVAQPYVLRPLLLPSAANRKFHIRVYVLAVGSLKVYVYREMLALFADKSYVLPWEKGETDEDELSYLTRHLTNTCLQYDSTGQDAAPENVQRFWKLDDKGASVETGWKDRVYDQICAVTGEVFEAAARGMMVHFQPLPNAFEIFGVDYLVDETGNAWLLELNAFPDFRQTGDELKCEVIGKLFDEVVEIAVKPFFFPAAEKGNAADEQTKSRLRLVADLNLGIK
ncbi:tubulin-tyrosine ligase family protein [Trichophyton equinum CBS 127.97]|uniref:Tubulin-tyrosine ligase family protein n=1 Tax=Trichophyton equinum (strain ATCC MYA-4606 / CBS 127.97) TaxID=559882 RepID=F2PW96_TRIEC|nr:tubulin-tyrosine ligase family protein [Trichophyton equinum CBS 127.97]